MKLNRLLAGSALVAALALSAVSANATSLFYNFTWSDAFGSSAVGQIITDGTDGTAPSPNVTNVTGTQTVGAVTSAIFGTSPYAVADNRFLDPVGGSGQRFTISGVSYATLSLGAFNMFWNGGNFDVSSNVDPGGYVSSGHPMDFRVGTAGLTSETAGAVPEPTSWALMIVGFGGVGATLRRRRQHRTVALA